MSGAGAGAEKFPNGRLRQPWLFCTVFSGIIWQELEPQPKLWTKVVPENKQFQLRITAEQRLLFVGTGSEVLSTEALFASSCKFQLKCYSLASKTETSQF